MDKKEVIMEKLYKQKKNLEDMGYNVAYICLFGSQNYDLDLYTDDYKSDFDMKAIVIPDLDSLVQNSKPVSTKYEYEDGEIDIKDIRVFIETLTKTNPAYIETLYTLYYIIDERYSNEINSIISKRDLLIYSFKPLFAKAIYGMMMEKQNAMTHPYPKTKWKIDKWGFDGKQSSHCIRLAYLMKNYFVDGTNLSASMIPNKEEKEIIMRHKLNQISLDEAEKDVEHYIQIANEIKNEVVNLFDIDPTYKNEIIKYSRDIIKKSIINEVKQNY